MIDRQIPAPGEIVRTALPDSLDGIRFEIGRLVKYVQEGHKDPLIIATAEKIVELAAGTARKLGRKVTTGTRELIWLEGIHAWCHKNFEHVENPAGAEVIKTPARMLRELEIPEGLAMAFWEPIRDSMAKADGKDPLKLKLPKPKVTGSTAISSCLVLTLAAAAGIAPVRFAFGGHHGSFHYLWGSVFASGKWHDVDILLPKFGKRKYFDSCEVIDVPI